MLRTVSHLALPLALALTVPTTGCATHAASAQNASPESAARAPVATTAHGLVKLVGEALSDVPLTADQRAHVNQIATDAEARHADARSARRDLILALADQVQSGHLDRAALGPKVDALAGALAKAQPGDRAAFEQLHGVLNADQRVAFVDALEAKAREHMGAMRDAHPLRKWAGELNLTADQKSRLQTAFKTKRGDEAREDKGPHHGMHGERQAKILKAFKEDTFVIDQVAPPADVAQQVAKTSERFFSIAETALPILTAEQRATAASKLRERADALEDIGPAAQPL